MAMLHIGFALVQFNAARQTTAIKIRPSSSLPAIFSARERCRDAEAANLPT